MTNANAYLGQKKDSPASLVGQYASICRTALPFPHKDVKTARIGCVLGVSSRTFVL